MTRFISFGSALAAIALGTFASLGAIAPRANAQAAYGSYIGVGGSVSTTENPDGDREAAGIVAARYKFLTLPISLRAQAFFNGDGAAVVPTLSYDIPITWQADVYVGAGGSFVFSGDTPVGDQTSIAIQPGIDFAIPNTRMVVFGNAIFAFDAYEDEDDTAISVQGGLGLRF